MEDLLIIISGVLIGISADKRSYLYCLIGIAGAIASYFAGTLH